MLRCSLCVSRTPLLVFRNNLHVQFPKRVAGLLVVGRVAGVLQPLHKRWGVFCSVCPDFVR